jgi:hypothetical protein
MANKSRPEAVQRLIREVEREMKAEAKEAKRIKKLRKFEAPRTSDERKKDLKKKFAKDRKAANKENKIRGSRGQRNRPKFLGGATRNIGGGAGSMKGLFK